MLTSDFDYALPKELIAKHPAPPGKSRLLIAAAPEPECWSTIADLPSRLQPEDLLIVNDTRVIPARLFGRRQPGGGRVEVLLVEHLEDNLWTVLARPTKRLRADTIVEFEAGLTARVVGRDGSSLKLHFSQPVDPLLERIGHVPLPPYIDRQDTPQDRERYQTMFAKRPGAIAAPTAGLHFSPPLVAALEKRGVAVVAVTLHVGPGTFKPVATSKTEDHRMDEERYSISRSAAKTINLARSRGRRVVAVGTTVVRALESAAIEGSGEIPAGDFRTKLFITPGFRFQVAELLLTNFHLPRSTLLMLVSAFAGRDRVLEAYQRAIAARFRFYSYGDAMLVGKC